MDWLKNIYFEFSGKDKKITNLAIVLIIGIIILIAGGSLFKSNENSNITNIKNDSNKRNGIDERYNQQGQIQVEKTTHDFEQSLEKRLENILSQIEGVGLVSVMITLNSGGELIPASDMNDKNTITEEKDTSGGSRMITQSERENKILIMGNQSAEQKPLLLKEIQPDIKGVIVAAEGATDIRVKSDIREAAIAVLGVSAHNVQVYKKKL